MAIAIVIDDQNIGDHSCLGQRSGSHHLFAALPISLAVRGRSIQEGSLFKSAFFLRATVESLKGHEDNNVMSLLLKACQLFFFLRLQNVNFVDVKKSMKFQRSKNA